MSLAKNIVSVIKPVEIYRDPTVSTKEDSMKGSGDRDAVSITSQLFNALNMALKNQDRAEFIKSVEEMIDDFALAEKTLEKLCGDATAKPVTVDAPVRRRKVIEEFLSNINYEHHRRSWLFNLMCYGDLFLQKFYMPSAKSGRIAYIEDVMNMPVTTMVRNTNERDEFYNLNEAFFQVPHITQWPTYGNRIPFHYAKILHARNDWERSKFFRYGRSLWASAVRVYNMAVMSIEDSAIQRHQSTQNVLWHLIGRHSDAKPGESVINEYARRVQKQYTSNTVQMFIDGTTEIQQTGGTKSIIGTVDDIRLVLSILAIALDYPLDLLSVGVTGDSGGEELFRKEVVLKRTVEQLIKRELDYILKPMVNDELYLAGEAGKYKLIAFPASFEDATKRSKRGLLEYQAGVKSFQTYHEENNPEISFEEEKKRIQEDVEWKRSMGLPSSNQFTKSDPSSGERGAMSDPEDQQERVTPGGLGTDDTEE